MKQQLIQSIALITGHDINDFNIDMELESELGFDSIKSIELFSQLHQCLPQEYQDDFVESINHAELMCLVTIKDILNYLKRYMENHSSKAAVNGTDISIESTQIVQPQKTNEDSINSVAVLHSQQLFLVAHWAVSNCSLCSHIRITGSLNHDMLQQTWQTLLDCHPSLRGYFDAPKVGEPSTLANYRFVIAPQLKAPGVNCIDISDVLEKDQSNYLLEKVAEKSAHVWNINESLLHSFEVIQLNEACFEVFFHNHHLISDGLSNQKIIEQFVKIYDALLSQKSDKTFITYDLEDYHREIQKINQWRDHKESLLLKDYLAEQGRDNFLWNPQKKSLNKGRIQHVNRLFKLNKQDTQRLINGTGKARLSMNSVVVAAYLHTISLCDPELKNMVINIPTSGRIYPEVNVFDMVGCFAQNMALSFALPKHDGLEQNDIIAVESAIHQALANGMDRAQTHEISTSMQRLPIIDEKIGSSVKAIIKNSVKSNVFLSFIGQTHFDQTQNCDLSNYHPATTTAANTIDTLVEFFDGEMILAVNADLAFFDEIFIDKFGDMLIQTLTSVGFQKRTNETAVLLPSQVSALEVLTELVSGTLNKKFDQDDSQKDLESELGMDSLQRIRIISKLRNRYQNLNPQALIQARSLHEMVLNIPEKSLMDMPYTIIAHQCHLTPDAVAIESDSRQISYADLDKKSNQIAHYLQSKNVKENTLVAIMSDRSIDMVIGLLGILKAGGAYVPIDPNYPETRISYILKHSKAEVILYNGDDFALLDNAINQDYDVKTVICLNENLDHHSPQFLSKITLQEWMQCDDQQPTIVNDHNSLMCVLYTSGSTGVPKGVTLTHKGYTNRLEWMQKTFELQPNQRVAHKTSCCFDISVWEIFWPLMYGATMCPIDNDSMKNPWDLAQWIEQKAINVIHFVPSLFGEFLNIIESESYSFKDLKWLIFSGEVLPVSFIKRWMGRYQLQTGLANLYGPTEASIDVSCYLIDQIDDDILRLPIGRPVDNTSLHIMDQNMNLLSLGEEGELYIAGVQLAKGYLYDEEKTKAAFIKNPFNQIDSDYLYRSGDLAVELPDGNFEYRGRTDNQIKIRGFRVELGEIEAVLDQHPEVMQCVVITDTDKNNTVQILACISAKSEGLQEQVFRQYCQDMLPQYMQPHAFHFFDELPKNSNGKLDRKVLKMHFEGETETTQLLDTLVKDDLKIEHQLPLGPAQKWLLRFFEKPYRWCGYSRFSYNGPLDKKVFHKSINVLLNKHESLRTVFRQGDKGQFQQIILTNDTVNEQLNYQDISDLSVDKQDDLVSQSILSRCESLNIDVLPLFNITIYKTAHQRHEILVVAHHLVCDMLSSSSLFAELWNHYALFIQDKAIPEQEIVQYRDFIAQLPHDQSTIKKYAEYWRGHLESQARLNVIPDNELGKNTEFYAERMSFGLDKQQTQDLQRCAKEVFGASFYHTLLGPLYKIMAKKVKQPSVIISHRSHGRALSSSSHFLKTIGNFACNFPVMINTGSFENPVDLVKGISEQFEQIPMKGISYDWVSDILPDGFYPDHQLTSIRSNYLGVRDLPRSKLFSFKPENYDARFSPPKQKRTCEIEFIFSIIDGGLQLNIEYSHDRYQQKNIKEMGNAYLQCLLKFINEYHQPFETSNLPVTTEETVVNLPNKKAVVVTHADHPFGQQLIERLLITDSEIFITGQRQDVLLDMVEKFPQVTTLGKVDLRYKPEIKQAIDRICDKNITISTWINAHGFEPVTALSSSSELTQSIWENRVNPIINSCDVLLQYFKNNQSGQIINVMSELAFITPKNFAAHAAAEHAIRAYSDALSNESAIDGMRVNCICPSILLNNQKLMKQQQEQTLSLLVNLVVTPHINGECYKLFENLIPNESLFQTLLSGHDYVENSVS